MLNTSDVYEYPSHAPALTGKAFSFSPLSVMLAGACHIWPLLC